MAFLSFHKEPANPPGGADRLNPKLHRLLGNPRRGRTGGRDREELGGLGQGLVRKEALGLRKRVQALLHLPE